VAQRARTITSAVLLVQNDVIPYKFKEKSKKTAIRIDYW